MSRIFVSYARPTVDQARLIAQTLRGAGHEVWIDDELLAHRSFTDAIAEQLDAADAVVVVWSPEAAKSEWVRAEASRARTANKLVQVRVAHCELPMPYDQIHCVDLSGWSGNFERRQWRSVLDSIAAVTRRRTAAAPAPASRSPVEQPPVDRRSERRQITALYCDLANAGALTSRLDPEDMMQVLDAYHAACDDIVAQFGGAIAKYSGHGVLAYFGYPRTDEEEAANAVRAGLAFRDAVAALDLPEGVSLRTRVGVATGLVVISQMVGRDTGIVGETPTLAAQLESVAPPGGVVVSEGTHRLTEGLFDYRDLGEQSLRGYDTGARCFEALNATVVGSRSQARGHAEARPIFGRENELRQMRQAWELSRGGEGQVVLVQGEAGIGKSGLVDEFKRLALDPLDTQITFFCGPNYRGTVLHPVSDLFARASGFGHADSADTRRSKLDRVLAGYGPAAPAAGMVLADLLGIATGLNEAPPPERRKVVTFDTLLTLMGILAQDLPALFIFEDLHWADPTTLEFLDLVTREASSRPWMILGTARPEFVARWFDHADVVHIELGRLDRGDAERILAALGAENVLPAAIIGQIIARSDGVPLFVEEMTKAVLEDLAASGSAGAAPRLAIPDTLRDSLSARLDRLGPAKAIASLGAAIGRRFGYELLAAVAPQSPADLRQALREITNAGLVDRHGVPPASHYVFRHALVRDAAYDSLLKREREALHGRIARALRDQFPETSQAEPALLAFHLTESGASAEAAPLWAEAGRRAAALGAHAEAAAHLRTAIDLTRKKPVDGARLGLELQLLLGLAVSLATSRGYSVPEVGEVLSEARAICDALGNVPELFGVLRGICNFMIVAGNVKAAEEIARQCLAIAEETGDIAWRIESHHPLGHVLWTIGEFAAARQHLERAISLYREHDGARLSFPTPQDPLVGCLVVIPWVLEAIDEVEAAAEARREAVAHARRLGRTYDLAYGLAWHATQDLAHAELDRAERLNAEASAICQANGYDTYGAVTALTDAFLRGRRGDVDTALAMAERGLAQFNKLGIRHILGWETSQVAELQVLRGDWTGALTTMDMAIERTYESGERCFLSPLYRRRAEIRAMSPDAGKAEMLAEIRADLAAALDIATQQGATAFAALAEARLAEWPD